ncbi:small ribosomal subunit protein uS14m-like [Ochotona princeps]|uniref:small ribosomal subunit protein uS14m-like n=1 Tax=Ochotona princeps TaxID=9978 RepID=UPI002714D270|nr:small ribosomal subunit protein uS14m-like [Ochotona princeps]
MKSDDNASHCTAWRPHGGLAAAEVEQVAPLSTSLQVRGYYVDWRTLSDAKRRTLAYEFADERLRINSLGKNTILPKDFQQVANEEIAALPRDSCPVRIRNHCVMTSGPHGLKRRWGLSRIVFPHLADHGQFSGVQLHMANPKLLR